MHVNPYEKAMQGTKYGTIQTLRDNYDHLHSYRG